MFTLVNKIKNIGQGWVLLIILIIGLVIGIIQKADAYELSESGRKWNVGSAVLHEFGHCLGELSQISNQSHVSGTDSQRLPFT